MLFLPGDQQQIIAFNKNRLRIESCAQATEYLCFACSTSSRSEGNYRIIETPGDLLYAAAASPDEKDQLDRLIVPVSVRENENGKWAAKAIVRFGGIISAAVFEVDVSGRVVMRSDLVLRSNQPIFTEAYVGGARVISDYPWRVLDVGRRSEKLNKDARWSEAAAAMRELTDFLEATDELGSDFRKAALARYLLSLSWYQLNAGDFTAALASAERGLQVNPEDFELDTNRAHALMFLGRHEEADALYRKHIGQLLGERKWETAVLEDLDKLEAAGRTHPAFAGVRSAMHG